MTNLQPKVPSNEDINIEAGPSEDDLFTSLRYGSSQQIMTSKVVFQSTEKLKFVGYVTCLERGAGITWMIKGFALDPKQTTVDRKWRPFSGHYDSSGRTGTMLFYD